MALLRVKRVEYRAYVTWIRRSNCVRNVRVVNGRSSSRYGVRGLGFCDLNSPDISRRTFVIALAIKLVPLRIIVGLFDYAEAIAHSVVVVTTNLCQRVSELLFALPLNVYRTFLAISNLHRVQCEVWDDWKIAAAGDHNDCHDAYYNKPEFCR